MTMTTTSVAGTTARYGVDDEIHSWKRAGHEPGVLAVVDSGDVSAATTGVLARVGIHIEMFDDPWLALARFGQAAPQAVVVSVRAPLSDPGRFVGALRTSLHLPVLLALGDGDVDRATSAILAGGQPALALPLWPAPLLRALSRVWVDPPLPREVIRVGDMTLDQQSASGTVGGRALDLTGTEFALLWRLARAGGHVVRREDLWSLWPWARDRDGTLIAAVTRLRRKLEAHRSGGAIRTVRGMGYRLDVDGADLSRQVAAVPH